MARRAGLGRRGRPPLDVLVRLNPEVTPETIAGLAVGDGASKFGMTETEATGLVEWLATNADGAIRPRGVHLHVGSQLRAVDAWRDAVRRGLAVVGLLRGNLDTFDTLDVGGGFPVLPEDEPVPGSGAVRPRAAGPPGERARGSPSGAPRHRARPGARGAVRLARGPRPARARPRRTPGRHRCRHDRAHPTRALRRPPPDRRAHVARPAARPGRPPAHRRRASRHASRAPSASRPTPWARTTCRRSVGATSWPSATPARTPPRSPRPTTAGPRPPRSSSTWTGPSGSLVAPVPDGDRYPACDATPRRPAATPHPRAHAGRRRQRGVALTAPGRAAVPGSGRRPGRLRLRRRLPASRRSPRPRGSSTPSRRRRRPRSRSTRRPPGAMTSRRRRPRPTLTR